MKNKKLFFLLIAPFIISSVVFSQDVSTAVPFIQKNTDAASLGFGEIGVVSPNTRNVLGLGQNPALLQQNHKIALVNINYNKGFRPFSRQSNFFDSGVVFSIKKNQTIGLKLRYFSHGKLDLLNSLGQSLGVIHAYESHVKLSYAYQIDKSWVLGAGIGFVSSNVLNLIQKEEIKTFSLDFGTRYENKISLNQSTDFKYSWGLSLVNLGPRVELTEGFKEFSPATLKTGILIGLDINREKNSFGLNLAYQADKLLIPLEGYLSTKNSFAGMFSSFSDSPEGFKGEWNELIHQFGFEQRLFSNSVFEFSVREGLFLQATKGFKRQASIGIGLSAYGIYIDYAYTWRFLEFDILNNVLNLDVSYFSLGYQKRI